MDYDYVDAKAIQVFSDKIAEFFDSLSNNAKSFIINNLEEDDILDFYHTVSYYEKVIEERCCTEPNDEHDLNNIQFLKTYTELLLHICDEPWE